MTRSLAPLVLLLAASLAAAEIPISDIDVVPFDRSVVGNGYPSIAAGDGFLLTWDSMVHQGLITPGPTWVRAYDASGPREPVAFAIYGGIGSRAVWTGSEYLVTRTPLLRQFGRILPTAVIEISRVAADGREVPSSEVRFTPSRGAGQIIALAWDGAYALAAVGFYNGTYATLLLDRNGQVVSETPIDFEPSGVAARSGGGFYVLPRAEGDAVAAGGIWFASIDNLQDGGVVGRILDSTGAEIDRITITETGGDARSVAWTGTSWVTVYRDGSQLCTAHFTASNVETDCVAAPGALAPVIAAGDSGTLTAWWQDGQIVTSKGVASTHYSNAELPAAVVDDTGLLVAWSEAAPIGGKLIHVGGLANDGARRPEHVLDGMWPQLRPRLSRSGGQTLLLWSEGQMIFARRVDAAGRPFGEKVRLDENSAANFAVTARNGAWLVVFQDFSSDIVARELSPGLVASESDRLGSEEFGQGSPAVAATSDGYLAVWIENSGLHVGAQRVEPGGRRGGDRVVIAVGSSEERLTNPSVGCNAEHCLITWFRASTLMGRLVRHDGTPAGEPRAYAGFYSSAPVILVLGDGSFQVVHGTEFTTVAPTGESRGTIRWSRDFHNLGDAVIWRGKLTFLTTRVEKMQDLIFASRVFAVQLPPRTRSVRH